MDNSQPNFFSRLFAHLQLAFITGLLVLGPLLLTIWLLFTLFDFVDGVMVLLPDAWQPVVWLGYDIPGLGVLFSLIFVYTCGLLMQYYIGKRIVDFYESLLSKVPIISGLYNSLKQLITTLFSSQGKHFQDVVLVQYPRAGIYSFAFVTNNNNYMKITEESDLVSIFLPSTPNPTTGFYLLIPKSDILLVSLTVEEAFKVIMSAGIVTPSMIRTAKPYGVPQMHPKEDKDTKLSPPTMM